MWFGCDADDTLIQSERDTIVQLAADHLPAHRAAECGGRGGVAWVVLEPLAEREGGPRFTICRIAPSLVVMIEDGGNRQFVTAGTIEAAMDAICAAADGTRGQTLLN